MPGKKWDRNGVLATETLPHVDLTYDTSDRMTSNDAQEAVPLTSMEYQSYDDDGHIVDSDEHENEPAEEMAWYFHDF